MMARYCVLGMVVMLAGLAAVPFASPAEPIIAKSLALLEKTPPVAPNSFDFIVTGDSHSNRQLAFQTDVFKQMIREWNILEPAFVIEVGDLVLGGSADNLPVQWDLFERTIAECRPPYFSAPGNHDISDAASEKIWNERMGPAHYAFSCGNSRFIVLNSEEVDALDRLSDAQTAWFKHELETAKAANIFVFIHQPYFMDYDDPRLADRAWERRWNYLAELMRGHPVRAVFAGHQHGYRYFGIRDGVHYVVAAGAASFGKGPEWKGGFNHYLLVRVRGEHVGWSVIKPGAVLPPDVATNDRAAEVFDITHRLVACDDQPVSQGQSFDREVTVRILNPFDKPFDSSLAWEIPQGWKVEPTSRDYTVAASGEIALAFHVAADTPEAVRHPVPSFRTRYANTSFGEPLDVVREMPLVPVAEAVKAADAIRVDGVLDEWNAAAPIALAYPLGFAEGAYDPGDLSGKCRAMWDADHLYIAFEITDNAHYQPYGGDIVWLADAIEFGIDRHAWGVSLTKNGPEVFLYYSEGLSAETVNKDVPLAVRREKDRTLYEMAFPKRLVQPLALETGSSFRFKALVADVDYEGGPKHELSLWPGDSDMKIMLKE
ncbi:MAG TPA: metallophosphoesterase [Candidatus Hydrogenedentes bacterium]|nr:metallophosphoesterase [Candidatus Hydrogenedentota bacterium]